VSTYPYSNRLYFRYPAIAAHTVLKQTAWKRRSFLGMKPIWQLKRLFSTPQSRKLAAKTAIAVAVTYSTFFMWQAIKMQIMLCLLIF